MGSEQGPRAARSSRASLDNRIPIGLEDIKYNHHLHRQLFAEFVGTALLVLVVCGSLLSWQAKVGGLTSVSMSLSAGFITATTAQALGHVSEAHFNPATSFGLAAAGENSFFKALLYSVAQCTGSTFASVCLYWMIPKEARVGGIGNTNFQDPIRVEHALAIEFVTTFILVLTVCGVADRLRSDLKGSAPLAVGICVAACSFFSIPLTGGSMNPARSFGPAIVSGNRDILRNHWVYWIGPISGGVSAGLLYRVFRAKNTK